MKTLSAFLITISLAVPAAVHGDTLPPVDLTCGKKAVVIFENHTSGDAQITIQASDHCTGDDSLITVHTKTGSDLKLTIKDDSTNSFTFAVQAGKTVTFDCNGKGGGKCAYVIAMH
jgi:hypothetical protein